MPNPLSVRLQNDFLKVKSLVEESGGSLRLLRVTGSPPTVYVLEYHCPGLALDAQQQPVERHEHQVEITLGKHYPFEQPAARLLTPIFNPHVFSSQAICLGGVWNPTETLDSLVLRIGALLQLDPKVLNFNSPANGEATRWAMQHRHRLPLGQVTFKAPTSPRRSIEWK